MHSCAVQNRNRPAVRAIVGSIRKQNPRVGAAQAVNGRPLLLFTDVRFMLVMPNLAKAQERGARSVPRRTRKAVCKTNKAHGLEISRMKFQRVSAGELSCLIAGLVVQRTPDFRTGKDRKGLVNEPDDAAKCEHRNLSDETSVLSMRGNTVCS